MVDSKSWETEVTGKPGFNSGFSAVTVFRLGTDSTAYCQASNSAASLRKFRRCNCYFLLRWGTRNGSMRGELPCNLCLEPLLEFLQSGTHPRAAVFHTLECYLCAMVEIPKQKLMPTAHHDESQIWRHLVQELTSLGPDSIRDQKGPFHPESNKLWTFVSASQNFALASSFCLRLAL